VTTRILDASVAAAWYLPESFSAKAKAWQRRMLDGDVGFLVPRLHYWELANVLRTYVRRREITAALALDIYALHLHAPLEVAEPAPDDVLKLALEHATMAYDAVYIALAIAHNIPIVTGERPTTPWVASLGPLAEPL